MFELTVNNIERQVDVDPDMPDMPLLWVLRDYLGLMGTKYGCGVALCGACTVHLNGEPVRSCQVRIDSIGKSDNVVTIEGITAIAGDTGKIARAVQAAWQKLDVVQCGYCQTGQIMTAIGLLLQIRGPSDADIDNAMDAIICRCATYLRIRAAIHDAAKALT